MNGVVRESLDYYARPGRFTDVRDCGFSSTDVREIVEVVQGLLVYDLVAEPFYGAELTSQQVRTIHERDSSTVLAVACSVDGRRLDEARPPAARVGGRVPHTRRPPHQPQEVR